MSRATHDPRNDPPNSHASEQEPGLIAALAERLRAESARIVTLGEIALAETRLAGTSALILLALALFGAGLAIIVWLLLLALAAIGLVTLGLGPAAALGILLVLHAAIGALLFLLARRMLTNLRFDHTLGALGRNRAAHTTAPAADNDPAVHPVDSHGSSPVRTRAS